MPRLYLIVCCLLTLSLSAQTDTLPPPARTGDFAFPERVVRYYALSARQAKAYLDYEIGTSILPGEAKLLPATIRSEQLPPGHYLLALLEGEEVMYSYFNTYRYQARALRTGGKFTFWLYDAAGRERSDARVLADGRPVPYDDERGAYRRRDWRIDLLTVAVAGDTLFYSVEEALTGSRLGHVWSDVSRTQPVRTLLLPYYYGRSAVRYVSNGIRYGEWRVYNYPFRGLWQRIRYPKEMVGYVGLNKPEFRPGDSVKVAAYLSYPKGRPLGSKKVRMIVTGGGKRLVDSLGRDERGQFNGAFVVPEDWPLDRDYRIRFELTGWRWRRVAVGHTFRVRDYELDEYRLEAEVATSTRAPGSAWVDVRAEDVNGQVIPEGELRTTVLLDRIVASADTNVLILPDTLFSSSEPLGGRRERRVVLPDSLFPYGHSYGITVVNAVRGVSGEGQTVRSPLVVDRLYAVYPEAEVVGDSLRLGLALPAPAFVQQSAPARPKRTPREESGAAPETELITVGATGDTTARIITLPVRLALDHRQKSVLLRYGAQTARVDLSELKPTEGEPYRWSRDTLRIEFANPHGQPLRWTLRDGAETLATGDEASPRYETNGYAPGTQLVLSYRYLAGGTWRIAEQGLEAPAYDDLTADKKVLDFDLAGPPEARPGATVPLLLTVRDQRGRPAPNVRVTAGTYNARFTEAPVMPPAYETRRGRTRKRQGYGVGEVIRDRQGKPSARLVWDFHRDSILIYRLLNPRPAFTHVRSLDRVMPAGRNGGHLTVHALRDQEPQRVHTIYANDRLVYYYHPAIGTPYSVPLDTGRQRISVRTRRGWYRKDLRVPNRAQLVVSFDTRRFASAGWSFTPAEKVERSEQVDLQQRLFALAGMRFDRPVVFRGDDGMLRWADETYSQDFTPLGLAVPNTMVDVWLSPVDSVRLLFEPAAKYRIGAGRDRLYPLAVNELTVLERSRYNRNFTPPGIPKYAYDFSVEPPKGELQYTVTQWAGARTAGARSRLQPGTLVNGLRRMYLVDTLNNRYHELQPGKVNELRAGDYELLYRFANDSLRTRRITLPEDRLLYLPYEEDSTRFVGYFSLVRGYEIPRSEEVTYTTVTTGSGFITGTVRDEDDEPLIGVSVIIDGTRTGTVTDIDGRFSIRGSAGETTLKFNYTGFSTTSITVSGSEGGEVLDVVMDGSAELLDQVVVVGYGTSRRRPETRLDVTKDSYDGLSGALQGRAAGLVISDDYAARTTTDLATGGNTLFEETAPTYRKNFTDAATFHPALRTDRNGRAVIPVTLPDNITAWNTYAVGQDRRRRVGFTQARTRAFLPLQAQLYLPRFLVTGDRSEAVGLAVNRSGQPLDLRLSFSGDGVREQTTDTLVTTARETRYAITAPPTTDSLRYRFTLTDRNDPTASDGEERDVPVFPRGTLTTVGRHFLVGTDTPLPTDFFRSDRGEVTLRVFGNRVEQLLGDAEHVIDYPYDCTEQTASRLLGLLALRTIRTAAGEPFTAERRLRRMITRLEKLRRPDGGYGWWPASVRSTVWISHHVYRALSAAARAGYPVEELMPLRRYLLGVATDLPLSDRLAVQLTFAEEGNPPTDQEMTRLDSLLAREASKSVDVYRQLALARLRQLKGDTVATDSLLRLSTQTATGGRYFGEQRFHFRRQPLGRRLSSTLLARRLFATAGDTALVEELTRYLLAPDTGPGARPLLGTNTLESALLLAELVPALVGDGPLRPPVLLIDGPFRSERVADFPHATTFGSAAAESVRLGREGSGPLPVVAYQRYFETAPTAEDNGFTVTSRFTDERQRPLTTLRVGERSYLEVTVTTTADADYVLVEIPVPAGCSYADRTEPRGPHAVHRAYRRDRVAVFCDRLPRGTHTYRVALEPRLAGDYTVNPARAELQYVPTVNGANGIRRLTIE